MAKKKSIEKTVHLVESNQKKRFYCGKPVLTVCDPDDWEIFQDVTSTKWKDVTCTDCLESLYQLWKCELNQLGAKLGPAWVI